MRHLLVLFSFILCYTTCDKQNLEPATEIFGEAYYPLSVGNSWVYEMDSIVVRPVLDGIAFDSTRVQMQELLVDTFTDQSGQLWYRGERSFRPNEMAPWQFSATFLLGLTDRGALRKEGNLLFVVLGFPARQGHSWDGNSAFDPFTEIGVGGELIEMFNGWDYSVLAAGETSIEPEPSFPNVIRVEAANTDGLIDRRLVVEAYAKNVGLIYRELEILHTQCQDCCNGNTSVCLDLPWREKAEKGFILRQRLIEFQ